MAYLAGARHDPLRTFISSRCKKHGMKLFDERGNNSSKKVIPFFQSFFCVTGRLALCPRIAAARSALLSGGVGEEGDRFQR